MESVEQWRAGGVTERDLDLGEWSSARPIALGTLYLYWQTQDRKTLKRINALIANIKRDPDGPGAPGSSS
jgi:YoeB-like toxin of bacterial type II toxin-antitoxin system